MAGVKKPSDRKVIHRMVCLLPKHIKWLSKQVNGSKYIRALIDADMEEKKNG